MNSKWLPIVVFALMLFFLFMCSGCTTLKRAFKGVDPEPVVITTKDEVAAEVPERFTRDTGNEGLLPHGSTLADLIEHAGNQSEHLYECKDQDVALEYWKEQEKDDE